MACRSGGRALNDRSKQLLSIAMRVAVMLVLGTLVGLKLIAGYREEWTVGRSVFWSMTFVEGVLALLVGSRRFRFGQWATVVFSICGLAVLMASPIRGSCGCAGDLAVTNSGRVLIMSLLGLFATLGLLASNPAIATPRVR